MESYQVLLLDQRGTGLSTALNYETLSRSSQPESQTPTKSPSDSNPAQQMADLAKFFRADSIVRDAEEIRKILIGNSDNPKWSILGQSFGGFCAITYLSFLFVFFLSFFFFVFFFSFFFLSYFFLFHCL